MHSYNMHKDKINHWTVKKYKDKFYKTGDKRDYIAKVYRHYIVSTDITQKQTGIWLSFI
jgi:hypothetical protein